MNHILKVPKNTKGRDFFTTDVHGHFDLLIEAMREHSFSPANGDRLFSSGDWCDRGPQSEQVLDWLYEPWVYSTRANHEEMVIAAMENWDDRQLYMMLFCNGGQWFYDISSEKRVEIYQMFKGLPLAIELESRSGRKVGIIHAEVPYGDWKNFEGITQAELKWNGEAVAQWARTKYDKQDKTPVKNIDEVLVGHTPTNSGEIEVLGNVKYCDLGSFFRGKLCFMEIL